MASGEGRGASEERLRTETFVLGVEHHAEIASTNDRAMELCADVELPVPFLVSADHQTAGRGRGANRWWSSDGAILFSVIVNAAEYRLPESRWPQISLTAGAAVCQTLQVLLGPATSVGLKWPNDVWLNGRKAAGILVEIPAARRGRLVIGVGLNVNNSFESAPSELLKLATSMRDETGIESDRHEVLVRLLGQLDADLRCLAASDGRAEGAVAKPVRAAGSNRVARHRSAASHRPLSGDRRRWGFAIANRLRRTTPVRRSREPDCVKRFSALRHSCWKFIISRRALAPVAANFNRG